MFILGDDEGDPKNDDAGDGHDGDGGDDGGVDDDASDHGDVDDDDDDNGDDDVDVDVSIGPKQARSAWGVSPLVAAQRQAWQVAACGTPPSQRTPRSPRQGG